VLRGRCECNAVAYEVSDEFVAALNCHCSNCRASTGSAFLPFGEIARVKLETMGVQIDTLTEEQARYLASWDEGT